MTLKEIINLWIPEKKRQMFKLALELAEDENINVWHKNLRK